MRRLFRRLGAWADRHAFACRLIGFAAVVAFIGVLSASAERQRAMVTSYHPLPQQKRLLEAMFWDEDEASLRSWQAAKREWDSKRSEAPATTARGALNNE
jgi:hypothetical protein